MGGFILVHSLVCTTHVSSLRSTLLDAASRIRAVLRGNVYSFVFHEESDPGPFEPDESPHADVHVFFIGFPAPAREHCSNWWALVPH